MSTLTTSEHKRPVWPGFLAGLILVLGINGFIPDPSGVTWTMPLWLAVCLTLAGGVGIYFLRAKN